MNLSELNNSSATQREEQLRDCCGSSTWVQSMMKCFPFADKELLLKNAHDIWNDLSEADYLEAFAHHPKIGDIKSLKKKFASTANFAANEQASVQQASEKTLAALAKGNATYEEKFGYIFIVNATGKSAEHMLDILQSRLPNSKEDEIKIAAAEQAKITQLRLEKLLS